MNSINWKKLLPHFIAVVIFIIVSVAYTLPSIQGKVLRQHDVVQYEGSSQDIANYYKEHGTAPLWTNGMFSGMPTYQIWMPANNVLPKYANAVFSIGLPRPAQFFFLACLFFYFLSQVLGVNSYIGILGAVAFSFSTYDPVIISAGHETKMWCIAYMPAVVGSVILIYRKQYILGAGLLALFTSIQVGFNHLQITYYLLMVLFAMTIAYVVYWVKNKEFAHMTKALASALAAGVIGVMVNAVVLLTTYDYSKETIRGGSVALKDSTSTGGLSKDYAFSYSYQPMETFTVMVPKMYGGSNGAREFGDNSKIGESLSEMPPQLAQQLYGLQNAYWGSLDATSGPPYFGALICFLFLLSIAYLKSEHKWWIIGLSAFAIILSWGKFLPSINNFLFDYMPLYNKFRAPSMSLVILQLLWPIASILTLQQLVFGQESKEEKWRKFKTGLIITGAVLLILIFAYFSFDYMDESLRQIKKQVADANEQVKGYVTGAINAVLQDRKSFFGKDLFKTIALIGIFAALCAMYIRGVLKSAMLVIVAGILLIAVDLLPVGKLYLDKTPSNEDAYVEKTEEESPFKPGKADEEILKDKSNYRVLNLSVSPFQDATTSYNHKSIGGYHAAKIARYQDLFENEIASEIGLLSRDSSLGNGLSQTRYTGLNMLNTKYIIANNPPQGSNEAAGVIVNKNALGPCWFVKSVKFAAKPKDEMDALNGLDASTTAVVSEADKSKIIQPVYDSAATIVTVDNKENHDILEYKSKAATPQFAVFSEVYYNSGWNVYIDGKKTDYVKVNYALRGMNVPAGEHKIEFKFEPASYSNGKMLTNIGQLLILVLLAVAGFMAVKNKKS